MELQTTLMEETLMLKLRRTSKGGLSCRACSFGLLSIYLTKLLNKMKTKISFYFAYKHLENFSTSPKKFSREPYLSK